jgi:hypothetical protein
MPERIVWQRAQIARRFTPDRQRAHSYWLAARLDRIVEITGDSAISQERQSPLAALHIFRRDDRSANGQFQMLPVRSPSPSLTVDGQAIADLRLLDAEDVRSVFRPPRPMLASTTLGSRRGMLRLKNPKRMPKDLKGELPGAALEKNLSEVRAPRKSYAAHRAHRSRRFRS